MKKLFSTLLALAFVFTIFSGSVDASTRVRGYTTKRGTYVAPHFRTSKNSTKLDNYSTKGNFNPYTGKKGTVNPYKFKFGR